MKFSINPKLSEKSMREVEENNVYTFSVIEYQGKANKNMIKRFVEETYEVKVESVNTTVRLGKVKFFGRKRTPYREKYQKIAYVKLGEGDSIDEFNITQEN
jgi:large subunit ribosomal protein L23